MSLAVVGARQMGSEAADELVSDHLLHGVGIILVLILLGVWEIGSIMLGWLKVGAVKDVFWWWAFNVLKVVVDVEGAVVQVAVIVHDIEGVGGHQVKLGLGLFHMLWVDAVIQLDQVLLLIACRDRLPRRTIH